MILIYKGVENYLDPRFIAKTGDKVLFSDGEAKQLLKSEDWEEVKPNGVKRKGRRDLQANE